MNVPLRTVSLLTIASVLLAGCRATTVHSRRNPDAEPVPPNPTLVVLPFENLSPSRNAGLAAAELSISILFENGFFKMVDASQVASTNNVQFRALETTPWERQLAFNAVSTAAAGRATGADYTLTGSIGEFGFVDGFGETATVGITLRLVDNTTSTVTWSGSLSRRVASVAFSEESTHRLAHQVLADLITRMTSDLRAQ
jgi:TolB-like protein